MRFPILGIVYSNIILLFLSKPERISFKTLISYNHVFFCKSFKSKPLLVAIVPKISAELVFNNVSKLLL